MPAGKPKKWRSWASVANEHPQVVRSTWSNASLTLRMRHQGGRRYWRGHGQQHFALGAQDLKQADVRGIGLFLVAEFSVFTEAVVGDVLVHEGRERDKDRFLEEIGFASERPEDHHFGCNSARSAISRVEVPLNPRWANVWRASRAVIVGPDPARSVSAQRAHRIDTIGDLVAWVGVTYAATAAACANSNFARRSSSHVLTDIPMANRARGSQIR